MEGELARAAKAIPLRKRGGEIAAYTVVDAEDYAALSAFRWFRTNSGYAARTVRIPGGNCQTILLHRELLALEKGDPLFGDHINRDRLDNRRANLRVVTAAQNTQNCGARSHNRSSGIRGVYWWPPTSKWVAKARVNGRLHHIGLFENKEDAARAVSDFRAVHMPYSTD